MLKKMRKPHFLFSLYKFQIFLLKNNICISNNFLVDNNYIGRRIFVLKSLCIKTNNKKVLDYLLSELENTSLEKIYISKLKFKLYTNLIIHYKGKNLDSFYNAFSNILSSAILNFYEKDIIK